MVFGLKLVLSTNFNLNDNFFSEKFAIWSIWSRNRQKITQIVVFGHFLDFASLVFFGFAHNDRWAWCLVVFLHNSPVQSIFFFVSLFFHQCVITWDIKTSAITLRVIALVFMFVVGTRFPASTLLLIFYGSVMVRFWSRMLESLRNMTLNIRKRYMIWIFYWHVKRKIYRSF